MPGNDLSPEGITVTCSVFCTCCWILNICLYLFVTESVCQADQAITTAPPTSPSITTTAPTPTPAPGIPKLGRYNVTSGGAVCLLAQMGLQLNVSYFSRSQNKVKDSFRSKDNSMFLTLISSPFCTTNQNNKYLSQLFQTIQALVNLDPNLINFSGSCEASNATLILTEEQTNTLIFTFTLVRSSLLFVDLATWSVWLYLY